MPAGHANLPRELAPGVFWLGNCNVVDFGGLWIHGYASVYVVAGDDHSLVIDTGHPKDWAVVERQLDELLASGLPPVRYVFPTHAESAHASNLGRLLEKFPNASACGDVRDYHLIFPEFAGRLLSVETGESIDLGGRAVEVIEAIFHDSLTTRWALDLQTRTLFTADGFAYLHYHGQGECGKSAEEIPELPIEELTGFFADVAFYWTKFVDITPKLVQLERLLEDRRIVIIASAHGSPILDPSATVPKVVAGMKLGQQASLAEIAAELRLLAAR